ncbi:MAG: hypothetical protein ACE10K_14865 [Rhodothermales bacterium]
MPFCGDPRDLDTFNDDFEDPHNLTESEYADILAANAAFTGLEIADEVVEGPMREPCPECNEPAVAAWDHREECPYYEEMVDLPF